MAQKHFATLQVLKKERGGLLQRSSAPRDFAKNEKLVGNVHRGKEPPLSSLANFSEKVVENAERPGPFCLATCGIRIPNHRGIVQHLVARYL